MFKPPPPKDRFEVSYMDSTSALSTWSKHAIFLEDTEWPSVEHYVQAMKYSDSAYQEKIRLSDHPKKAKKLGESRWKKKKAEWKAEREIYMTRGMYIKCKTHEEVRDALMSSGELPILDTSNFDYFWGCGRDARGQNKFGKVLMEIRSKLQEETENGKLSMES